MTLHAENLLIEMREYTKNKIQNANLPPFVPSTEELRKLYNKVSCVDMSLYAGDAVIKGLKKLATDESLKFSERSRAVAEGSAKEVEKIDRNSTIEDKWKVTDRLTSDKQKIIDLATKTMDNVYDGLIDAVLKYPELTDAIVKLSETFSKGFNVLIDTILKYIEEVIKKLGSIGKTIYDYIRKIWKVIVDTIGGWFPR